MGLSQWGKEVMGDWNVYYIVGDPQPFNLNIVNVSGKQYANAAFKKFSNYGWKCWISDRKENIVKGEYFEITNEARVDTLKATIASIENPIYLQLDNEIICEILNRIQTKRWGFQLSNSCFDGKAQIVKYPGCLEYESYPSEIENSLSSAFLLSYTKVIASDRSVTPGKWISYTGENIEVINLCEAPISAIPDGITFPSEETIAKAYTVYEYPERKALIWDNKYFYYLKIFEHFHLTGATEKRVFFINESGEKITIRKEEFLAITNDGKLRFSIAK